MRTHTEQVDSKRSAYCIEFDSVAQMVEAVEADGHRIKDEHMSRSFIGGTVSQARRYALDGWDTDMDETMRAVESAVSLVETDETMALGFDQTYGVAGAVVDIDRYLIGEPECMIDFPLVEIVKAGRIITLCASVCYSGAVKAPTLIERGRAVAALALALAHLGYGIEVYADATVEPFEGGKQIQVRTLVKSATDELDPARLIYALAHPSMLRVWSMGAMWLAPKDYREANSVGGMYGCPIDPLENLPDGTIYLPCVRSPQDVPDAADFLRDSLRQLELID